MRVKRSQLFWWVIVCFFFACGFVSAEEFSPCSAGRPLDKVDLEKALGGAQKSYEETRAFTAAFTQSAYSPALDMTEASRGSVHYLAPGRMKWDYEAPEQQTFLVNGESAWFFQPTQNQVMRQDMKEILISDAPLTFLLGVGNLAKSFSIKSGCKADSAWYLSLVPSEKSQGTLDIFWLKLRESDFFPIGAVVEDTLGNKNQISLFDLKLGVEVSSEFFEPNFPKGVDQIEPLSRAVD